MCLNRFKLVWIVLFALLVFTVGDTFAEEVGFKPIFDGKTLDGWKSPNMSYFSVADGA